MSKIGKIAGIGEGDLAQIALTFAFGDAAKISFLGSTDANGIGSNANLKDGLEFHKEKQKDSWSAGMNMNKDS